MAGQLDLLRRHSKKFEKALESARRKIDAGMPRTSRRLGFEAARPVDPGAAIDVLAGRRSAESLGSEVEFHMLSGLEAIVLAELRPPYLVLSDKIDIDGDYDHVALIEANKAALENRIRSVGRVDLRNHARLNFGGTGWLVDEGVAVTNRHVARLFAETRPLGGYRFQRGLSDENIEARLDYVRQHVSDGVAPRRAEVLEVLYIATDSEPDIAFLKVDVRHDIEPLELHAGRVKAGLPIAAVGYPAWDGNRNDARLMEDYFKGVYDVKRFAPGEVVNLARGDVFILADYTSLGGNSGSPVIDLETGKAVGLHFAGAFKETNYAVASDIIAAARARIKTLVSAAGAPPPEAPTSAADFFSGRDGYDADFLGSGPLQVPMPEPGAWKDDVAPVSDDAGNRLKYRHFSVIQSRSRRLPLVTAVNIDGSKSIRLKRKGAWKQDGRLSDDHQIGNVLYARNDFDRGHMVRRMDPGWGDSEAEAQEGETDTFHFTNSAPQHKNLNQKDWVGLEDYILQSADTEGFKLCVFTGPVFRETDKTLRTQPGAEKIPIPEEFWKVAVMVNAHTGALSATGYVLSHGPMIRGMVEAAFVLGAYKTYQVQVARIEAETGLDFGALRDHDPLGAAVLSEAPFGEAAFTVEGPEDLKL